ncbi:hypothetical protein TNCV_2555401 [Trichonephila clavipes]|nr:hypothetical protein TNCV_2555401 [Trichonephila clavipes]
MASRNGQVTRKTPDPFKTTIARLKDFLPLHISGLPVALGLEIMTRRPRVRARNPQGYRDLMVAYLFNRMTDEAASIKIDTVLEMVATHPPGRRIFFATTKVEEYIATRYSKPLFEHYLTGAREWCFQPFFSLSVLNCSGKIRRIQAAWRLRSQLPNSLDLLPKVDSLQKIPHPVKTFSGRRFPKDHLQFALPHITENRFGLFIS